MTALAGSRARERRLALGLRQAQVAQAAGISASYLNLIEHNRRRIGPEVLARLAEVLGVPVAGLAEGAEGTLLEDLRAAAAEDGAAAEDRAAAELDRIEDFAGRFPGWAAVLAGLHRRAGGLARAVEALNDRMTHDPHLSASLHEMLQAVSAIRSTAGILAETEAIDPEWRARFHRNLHVDSERLAVGAQALVTYLDGPGQAEDSGIAAPLEEMEAWLAARDWQGSEAEVAEIGSEAARVLARAWVRRAQADAEQVPDVVFARALAEIGPDPARLAGLFGVDMLRAMRRIALVPGSGVGLVICDGSGTLTFRKPVAGFALPRFGAACPLWPLFTALARPMAPVETRVVTAGAAGRRFLVRAFCQPSHPAGFSGVELREAAMLILPDDGSGGGAGGGGAGGGGARDAGGARDGVEIGSTCRICPRIACPARREMSILGAGADLGQAG